MTKEPTEERQASYPGFSYINEYNMSLNFARNQAALDAIVGDERFDAFDTSVVERAFAKNEDYQPGGRYFGLVEGPIKNRDGTVETVFDIGVTIGHDICQENTTSKGRILSYLNSLGSLDFIKNGLIGPEPSTITTNGIAEFERLTIASNLPTTTSTEKLIDAIQETFEKAALAYPHQEIFNWYSAKVHFIKAVFKRQMDVGKLTGKYDEVFSGSEYSAEELKIQATLLTREAMQRRKYGTKPAYIEASMGGSWLFYDGDDWRGVVKPGVKGIPYEQYNNVAAIVFHSPHKEHRSLKAGINYNSSGVGMLTGGLNDAEPDGQVYILKDGSIGLDPEGLQDLSFLGLSQNRELSLRAELSSIFYDLSMPTYKGRGEQKNFATLTAPEKDTFDPIQDLLIPRVRLLGEAEPSAPTDIVRTLRAHDVTWFVRTLPAGYRASPESRAEAAERGIVLADNETFVRSHTRGNTQEVLGHRAVRRTKDA